MKSHCLPVYPTCNSLLNNPWNEYSSPVKDNELSIEICKESLTCCFIYRLTVPRLTLSMRRLHWKGWVDRLVLLLFSGFSIKQFLQATKGSFSSKQSTFCMKISNVKAVVRSRELTGEPNSRLPVVGGLKWNCGVIHLNVKATLIWVRTCLSSKVTCLCVLADDDVTSSTKQI